MSLEAIHRRRLVNFKILKRTLRSAKSLTSLHLNDKDLNDLGVQLSSLDLESGVVSQGSQQFFLPLTPAEFDVLPETTANYIPMSEEDLASPVSSAVDRYGTLRAFLMRPTKRPNGRSGFSWMYRSPWHEDDFPPWFIRKGAFELNARDWGGYEWRIEGLYSHEGQYPHLKGISTHDMLPTPEVERTIARSELLPLLSMILSRMPMIVFEKHEIYPVQMISFFGYRARILQAYFDGKQLRIQRSPFIDAKNDGADGMGLLCRWMLSEAVGDTKAAMSVE